MPYLELLVDTPKYKAGERAHFSKEAAAALTSIGTARILRSEETTDAEKGITPAIVSWGIHRGLHSRCPAIVGRCSREVCGILKFEGRPEDAHLAVFLHGHAGNPPEKVGFESTRKRNFRELRGMMSILTHSKKSLGIVIAP